MATFTPTQKYKLDKKGNFVLDDNGTKIKLDLYKATSFKEMCEFIKANGTEEEKAEFRKAAKEKYVYVESGKFYQKGKHKGKPIMKKTDDIVACGKDEVNILGAKKKFFEMYAPTYLPKKKEDNEPSAQDLLNSI